ncbi:hypothetical protein BCR42DRAFT_407169 [Absidia repens]|uniref:Uncharacterized protein n=1 Tax=Absidia repens TaxID=90262 RepID=A0A1X2IRV1_9FUNG|nr:hypothetical protein BCR42DRAFT_407169 [Absidia repens]
MSVITYPPDNTLVIGEVSHYHFYQSINQAPRTSSKYQPSKRIIPSVPRQHSKAPVNSPLSFIRQQKLPQHTHHTATPTPCRTPSSVNLLLPPLSSVEPPIAPSPTKTITDSFHKRPQSFIHSPANLLNLSSSPTKHPFSLAGRPRKVSFNENVMVICTRFDADEDDKDHVGSDCVDDETKNDGRFNASSTTPPTLVYQGRRHSTAGHITDGRQQRKRWLTFVESLKQWPSSAAA